MLRDNLDGSIRRSEPPPDLPSLIRDHCSQFGDAVRDLLLEQAKTPAALTRLLRNLEVQPTGSLRERVQQLVDWIEAKGSQELFRVVASIPSAEDFDLKPIKPTGAPARETQAMNLLIQKESAARTASQERSASSPPPAASPSPAPPPKAPFVPTALKKASGKLSTHRYRPENPISGEPPKQPPEIPPDGPFTAPPGYPFPWPPHLRPGPVPPPPDLPPDRLTWPYVDRRTGKDRRKKKDRRHRVEMVYRNRRYGGERRKKERRTG